MSKNIFTLVRRELWENNRYIFGFWTWLVFILILNLAFVTVAVTGWGGDSMQIQIQNTSYSLNEGIDLTRDQLTSGDSEIIAKYQDKMVSLLAILAMLINMTVLLMMLYYSMECLYRERKDQSILFWKSLPVSDTQVVLSKLLVILIVIPVAGLVSWIIASALTLSMQGLVFHDSVVGISMLWEQQGLLRLLTGQLWLLVEQPLWYFPIITIFLLSSAWATKASPYTIVILLPLVVFVLDKILGLHTGMNTLLWERTPMGSPMGFGASIHALQLAKESGVEVDTVSGSMFFPGLSHFQDLLMNVKLWLGLLVGIALLSITVYVRRWQGENL